MKRRSMHDPRLFKTTVTTVESEQDEVFPSPPEDETNQSNQSSAEIPSVETRTVVYEPNLPEKGQEISHVIGDPVVVTMKIDESPVSEARATHVVRHTSTPAQVVTKTITIEGDGEPLTAEELAEIMNMSEKETTTLNNSSRSSFHRVERIEKVEKVVTSTQFWQSGQSFVVETGDSDADAAIMKALEDARRQDPNVKVAEVTITKQELGDDD
ncbi:uncharacterized protein LOC124442428 [Xenia sp. Carnegie-2017]|uniref:uncharacterized protein LOC124442428 n=1 Tax=Xenia sp. Carnegie-2017 TaxID=2897299 RepID=UPI001F03C1D2|nr:uncharacterized protein LOC124442428 [Xenia sp. Carnegie-2017]